MAPKKVVDYRMTLGEATELKTRFPQYSLRAPHTHETSRSQPPGELCLFYDFFRMGMVLPIQDPILYFLRYFKMIPAMLTPNTYAVLLGLHKFFANCSIEWTIPNIMSLITFTSKTPGLFFAQVRNGLTFAVKGVPAYAHNWDKKYAFFSHSTEPWGIPTQVGDVDAAVFKGFAVADAVSDVYLGYNEPFFSLDLRTITVSFVRDRKRIGAEKKKKDDAADDVNVEEEEESEVPPIARKQPVRGGKRQRVEEAPEEILLLENAPSRPTEVEQSVMVPFQVEPSSAIPPAPTHRIPAGCSIPMEGTPRDPAVGLAERNFYVDKEADCLVSRFNNDMRFIPEGDLTDVPSAMVASMCCPADRQYLASLPDEGLMHLQSQMAFGSSMASQLLQQRAENRKYATKRLKSLNAKLLTEKRELVDKNNSLVENSEKLKKTLDENKVEYEKSTAELQSRVSDVESSGREEKALYRKENESLKHEMLSLKFAHSKEKHYIDTEVKLQTDTCNSLRADVARLRAERDDALKVIQELQSQTASCPAPLSAQQVIEDYKNSDAYTLELSSTGEDAFRILKDALVLDGVVAKSTLDAYDFDSCLDRDANGEFLPKE